MSRWFAILAHMAEVGRILYSLYHFALCESEEGNNDVATGGQTGFHTTFESNVYIKNGPSAYPLATHQYDSGDE